VREVCSYDPVRAVGVLRWPLRELMLAYVHRVKQSALADYRHETLVWASIAPHSTKKIEPPKRPHILLPAYSVRGN
jgi:hypothetical protein